MSPPLSLSADRVQLWSAAPAIQRCKQPQPFATPISHLWVQRTTPWVVPQVEPCVLHQSSHGYAGQWTGEGKAEVKASKRKAKGVNTQCVSVVLEQGDCNEDTGFCDLIKTSRGWALRGSPKMAEHQHVPSTPPELETLSSQQDQALQLVNTYNKTWVFPPSSVFTAKTKLYM